VQRERKNGQNNQDAIAGLDEVIEETDEADLHFVPAAYHRH